jgi:putative aldouronate transport system substrate-binding protein
MLPCNHPGYNQHSDYLEGFYPYAVQTEALKIWNSNVEKAITHKLPTLAFTEDELSEITDIKEIAEPELEVALCDIILGKKDISEYDAAIKAAKANGYDRWLEIQQDAYERFLSKK